MPAGEMPLHIRTSLGILCLLLFSQGRAELPHARLFTLFPPGGKAGTTSEVAVTGLDLDEADQLRFYGANIVAKQKRSEQTGEPEPNRFLVTIGAEVSPGRYETRAIGRFGVTNPRTFVVGDLPEITSPATNHTFEAATEVALGT